MYIIVNSQIDYLHLLSSIIIYPFVHPSIPVIIFGNVRIYTRACSPRATTTAAKWRQILQVSHALGHVSCLSSCASCVQLNHRPQNSWNARSEGNLIFHGQKTSRNMVCTATFLDQSILKISDAYPPSMTWTILIIFESSTLPMPKFIHQLLA